MRTPGSEVYAIAFFQEGHARHVEPVPEMVIQRLFRAAQFQAGRHGFLPRGLPCQVWLEAAGAPSAQDLREPFFARALRVVVTAAGGTFVRELDLCGLLPWIESVAALLLRAGSLVAEAPLDYRLFVAPGGDGVNGGQRTLAPLTIAVSQPVTDPARTDSLHPGLDCADYVPIVASETVLSEAVACCQVDAGVEQAGVFFGYLCHDPLGDSYVDVQHFCPALHTEAKEASLRFTRDTWAAINQRRQELDPNLQVVGWCHSHPRLVVAEGHQPIALFLSPDDVAIMAAFFDLPHLFAVVVDAEGPADPARACAVYGWDDTGVGLVRRSLNLFKERCEP